MMKYSLAVLGVGVLFAIGAGGAADTPAGIAVFTGSTVAGSIAVVLWTAARDRRELERMLVPVRVRRAADDHASMRRPR